MKRLEMSWDDLRRAVKSWVETSCAELNRLADRVDETLLLPSDVEKRSCCSGSGKRKTPRQNWEKSCGDKMRKGEQTWEDMSWEKLRWYETEERRDETRKHQVRWDEMRSDEVGRHGMRWGEMRRASQEKEAKSKRCQEKRDAKNKRRQMTGAKKMFLQHAWCRMTSYRHILFQTYTIDYNRIYVHTHAYIIIIITIYIYVFSLSLSFLVSILFLRLYIFETSTPCLCASCLKNCYTV
jgi:hypothetical protein